METETTEETPKRKRFNSTFAEAAEKKAEAAREEREVKKKIAKPRDIETPADLQKFSANGDLVDIWERRLLNPFESSSVGVRVKTRAVSLRWTNLEQPGRFQRAGSQGWQPVHKSELVDEREISNASYTAEGYVQRGTGSQKQMLMKMPEAVYRKIQQRKTELINQSYKNMRAAMGSAGHNHFKEKYGGSAGDMAAEVASQFKGSIKFGTENVSSEELFD